jgi:Fe2+ transport system protein B
MGVLPDPAVAPENAACTPLLELKNLACTPLNVVLEATSRAIAKAWVMLWVGSFSDETVEEAIFTVLVFFPTVVVV